jgi:hypothetical protein
MASHLRPHRVLLLTRPAVVASVASGCAMCAPRCRRQRGDRRTSPSHTWPRRSRSASVAQARRRRAESPSGRLAMRRLSITVPPSASAVTIDRLGGDRLRDTPSLGLHSVVRDLAVIDRYEHGSGGPLLHGISRPIAAWKEYPTPHSHRIRVSFPSVSPRLSTMTSLSD